MIVTVLVQVQSGETTDLIRVATGMGPYNQLNVYGMYCRIQDGDWNMGDIDGDNTDEITFTDIQPVNVSSRLAAFAALPLCCEPRQGMGMSLYLFLFRDKREVLRGNHIPLAIFNNDTSDIKAETGCEHCPEHTGKILLFYEPLAYYPTEKFNIKVMNRNTVAEDDLGDDTYSMVEISFLCEVVNKAATLKIINEGLAEEGMGETSPSH